jgi:hypothetical protein
MPVRCLSYDNPIFSCPTGKFTTRICWSFELAEIFVSFFSVQSSQIQILCFRITGERATRELTAYHGKYSARDEPRLIWQFPSSPPISTPPMVGLNSIQDQGFFFSSWSWPIIAVKGNKRFFMMMDITLLLSYGQSFFPGDKYIHLLWISIDPTCT